MLQRPSPHCVCALLQVTVTVVGIDVLFRVQSRDLLSIKLEQGRVTIDQRPVSRLSSERRTLCPSNVVKEGCKDLDPNHHLPLHTP